MIAMILIGSLSACGSGANGNAQNQDTLQIVTTIFPEYDWVTNILGDNPAKAEVTLLLDNGVDLHSFQPTAMDIMKISSCDLFIYVGGESDEWVEDALKEATNKDMIVIDLLDALGDRAKEEELVPGMESEEEEEGEEEPELDTRRSEAPAMDEHIWLSLRNAAYLVDNLSEAIQSIDGEHADVYKANTEAYTKKLEDLDAQYEKAVSEASFETIAFLAKKVDELSLPTVMTIEGTEHKIAETIVQNTKSKDQQILALDSMQPTTMKDAQNGTTYLSVMEKNLNILTKALN